MSVKRDSGFLRQSSWMVIATFAGGALMALVHTVARKMGPEEYSTFVTLLRVLIIMGIPSAALQTIFARQAAAVSNDTRQRDLTSTVRALLLGTFLVWVVCAATILAAMKPLSHLLKVSNPAALYFTLIICWTSLWIPIAKGLLQGQHRFFGLGWLQVSDGVGRFGVMVLVILFLGGKAAAAMFAAVAGQLVTIVIGAWLTHSIWSVRPHIKFAWKQWLTDALPLTLGMGTVLAMSSIDMLFVQGLFTDTRQTALYSGAMLTGFAIIQFIAPVALVMFARVAQNVARSERGDSLGLTLWATILFGALAGIGCTLLPALPLRLMYLGNPEMWKAAPLVPWFAWALLPLTVANVLIQNILARGRFKAVFWLVLVPPAYAIALGLQAPILVRMNQMDAFIRVIQTLGVASTVLCLVAAWFTRQPKTVTSSDRISEWAPAVSGRASSPGAQNKGATS
ncbi:MAG TPA: oligosaccharide flippase family protein [Verrucomicrobiae bacterium]|jgi:O-antigen/teichoic acid export membrane protein|nr:oligosaccharide flippase family protein [Verrucomicrobiae bacterium]